MIPKSDSWEPTDIIILDSMELHEVKDFHKPPYFRVMKVENGWLYNFWDTKLDDYRPEWVHVPYKLEL